MKNLCIYKILFLTLVFAFSLKTYAQGYLHRSNKQILDGNGNNFVIRGLGLGGWMLQEGYMMETASFAGTQHALKAKITDLIGEAGMNEFYDAWLTNHCTKADVDSLAKWGFNSIRLPLHYNLFTLPIEDEPVAGQNTWLEKGFKMVDSLLSWCEKDHIYLILDLHAAPGGQGHDANISDYDSSKPSLWESANNRAKTVALWAKLAERYANKEWIGGYDLLNEPNWDLNNGATLKALYVQIIAAIRALDNNHILFVEGNWYANDFTGLLASPLMDQNMAYSFHKYWNATNASSCQWMFDIRNNYNVPIWLGESGENSNEWFRQTIKMCEENNLGWSWWPLKKINSIVGPATIVKTTGYQELLDYWTNGGTKPNPLTAKTYLMAMAENAKIQNCVQHPDVIDAMFRQVSSDDHKPFKKLSIPGTIFFTDFDLGKVNSAYLDDDNMNDGNTTVGNQGGAYRNDGVDIESCGDILYSNGYNVGWTATGEWMKYTVNVAETGYYDVVFRASSTSSTGLFHVEVNGTDATGTVQVTSTGSYQTWKSFEIKNIPLTAGTDTLKFVVDHDGFNINAMAWSGPTTVTEVPVRMMSAATDENGTEIYLTFNESLKAGLALSVSDFALTKGSTAFAINSIEQNSANDKQIILHVSDGIVYTSILKLAYSGSSVETSTGKSLAAFSNVPVVNNMPVTQFIPGTIQAEDYTVNSGLSSEDCSDTGGGKDMGYTDPGDYLEYYIYVYTAGTYYVDYRYATPDASAKAKLSLYDNDTESVLTTFDLPTTNAWSTWVTKTVEVSLTAGMHRFRISVITSRFNTNYLTFRIKSTSTQQLTDAKNIIVYPNPTHGKMNISYHQELGSDFKLQVLDMCGKIVHQEQITNCNDQLELDLTGKPKGIYFLKLSSDQNAITKKLVID